MTDADITAIGEVAIDNLPLTENKLRTARAVQEARRNWGL
jgi:hypothetical protein